MSLKFNCPNPKCQQRVSVDDSMAGRSIDCPGCGGELIVPVSNTIKFSCTVSNCGQHIAVDVSEAGRYVKCPSCQKPLRVPGIPAKSILASVADATESVKTSEFSLFWRRCAGLAGAWASGAALVVCLLLSLHLRAATMLPRQLHEMAGELCAVGEIRNAPFINHAGTEVGYSRNTREGGGIFISDLQSLKQRTIMTERESGKMDFTYFFGWSPDDKYIAYAQTANPNEAHRQLLLCDPQSGSVLRSFTLPGQIEEVVWVDAHTLVVTTLTGKLCILSTEADGAKHKSATAGVIQLKSQQLERGRHWLTRTSDSTVAFIDRGNVWSLNVHEKSVVPLSNLPGNELEWLDYASANREFLFNIASGDENYLARYNPTSGTNSAPVSMSYEATTGVHGHLLNALKAMWVMDGKGVAFVSGSSSLNIIGEDGSVITNLFLGGHVRSYSASPDRHRLFAVAALKGEPLGIWEYDIAGKNLRCVVPGSERPFQISEIISPVKVSATSQSGQTFTYSYLPPRGMNENRRYPALINNPRDTRWAPDAQLFANAGIFFVYPASQSGVANGTNLLPDAQRTLTALYELRKNPNVDPDRIYILGDSGDTRYLSELIDYAPELWRGGIFIAPVAYPKIPEAGSRFPSILISEGEEDKAEYLKLSEDFTQAATQALVPVKCVRLSRAGHIIASTDVIQQRYETVAKFILSQY